MIVSVSSSRRWSLAIGIGALAAFGESTASAALIASDSFDIGAGGYTAGAQVPGQNPTIPGFSGAWASTGASTLYQTVTAGGGTIEIDQSAQAGVNQTRRSIRTLSAYTTASTYYFSGSVSAPTLSTGHAIMRFVDTNGTGLSAGQFGVGFGLSPAGVIAYFRNTSSTLAAVTLQAGATADTFYNIVAKVEVDQTSSSDRLTFWINPSTETEIAAGTPALVTLSASMGNDVNRAVDTLWLESSNTPSTGPIRFDNPKFGTAWEDVVTVPEPTVLGLAAMGIAVVVQRRRSQTSR